MERDQILARLRERIVRFAASRIQRDAAEDVAQEVLLVLQEKYSEIHSAEDLVPLSLEIARFKMMGAHRKALRRGENTQVWVDDLPLSTPEASPFELAAQRERIEHLESALKQLGERCRELFRLKLAGFKFAEIQGLLGAGSLNTLYTWDFRCRKQLLEQLGGEWDTQK